ncbi:DUF397 domain-containing protein [Streptomyces galbus]|uniref:DUF397 domain-containing protein n=1 Tax=Streptomyces galbus TaxID=33898 RepID=UPI003EBF99D1
MSDPLTWGKSSYSDDEGGNCVEVAATPATVHIRDSKTPKPPPHPPHPRLDRLRHRPADRRRVSRGTFRLSLGPPGKEPPRRVSGASHDAIPQGRDSGAR